MLLGKPENRSFLWFLDFWTCSWASKPISFCFKKNNRKFSKNVIWGNLTNFEINMLVFVGKDSHRPITKIRLEVSWQARIWDQDLPKHMERDILKMSSMGSIYISIYIYIYISIDMKYNLWNFEALKLRNQTTNKLLQQEIAKPNN